MDDTTLDIASLCQPISEENPVGLDLRQDTSPTSLYYKLREARTAARAIERDNLTKKPEEAQENPHWNKIISIAEEALTQSKDLEIAAWYTEALVRQKNFPGVLAGLTLFYELINAYGDKLYPPVDEEEGLLESTFMPLVGLNGSGSKEGTLIGPIKSIFITQTSGGTNFATIQYEQSLNLSRAPNEAARQELIKKGTPTLEMLTTAAKNSSTLFYTTLLEQIEAGLSLILTLTNLTNEKFGENAPSFNNIRKALLSCQQAIKVIAKEKIGGPAAEAQDPSKATSSAISLEGSTNAEGGTLSLNAGNTLENRTHAIDNMRTLAEFFKKTEPHSPIGYTLDRLVEWAGKSLGELLLELVPKDIQRDLERTTGVKFPEPPPVLPPQQPGMGAPGAYDFNNPYGGPANNYGAPAAYNPTQMGAAPMTQPGGFGNPYDPMAGGGAPPGGYGNNSFDPMGNPGGMMPPPGGGFSPSSF